MIEKPNNLIDRLLTSQILVGLDVGYKTIGIALIGIFLYNLYSNFSKGLFDDPIPLP